MSPGKQHTDGASWSSASLPSGWLLNTGSVLYFWQNFPLLGFVSMSLCLKKYLFISCYFPFVQSQALQNPCCSAQSHGHTHTENSVVWIASRAQNGKWPQSACPAQLPYNERQRHLLLLTPPPHIPGIASKVSSRLTERALSVLEAWHRVNALRSSSGCPTYNTELGIKSFHDLLVV